MKFLEHLQFLVSMLAILGVTIEIVPVKFSPLVWLGNRLNKGINDRLDDIEAKVDTNDIDALRSRIASHEKLVKLSKDTLQEHDYKVMFTDIEKWKKYHEKYPDLNGMIDIAIENIKEAYKQRK